MVRPTTRPRTDGSCSAACHAAYVSSGAASGSPPSSSVGSVVASITRSISWTTGSFSQVKALDAPRPWAMWTDLITASGDRSLTILSFFRPDMKGSTMAINSARFSALTSRPHCSRVATVPGSSRSIRTSIFAPSKPDSITPGTS